MRTPHFVAVFAVAQLVTLSACDCGQRTTQRFPQIVVIDATSTEVTSLDFGKVQLGTTATKTIRIRNSGPALLTVTKADFSKPVFGASTPVPTNVGVSEDIDFALTFTPATADLRETGTVTLSSNDPAHPTVQLSLSGTGVAAVALVEPAQLDFGEVYVTERKSLTVNITNTGSNDLQVQSAALVGAPASVTSDLTSLTKVFKAGESASAVIQFAPTATDTVAGTLDITFGSNLGTKHLALKGQGIQALPRLCLKFDDSALEQCTDGTTTLIMANMGTLCDNRLYPADGGQGCPAPDGGIAPWSRKAALYFRNEGNTPVSYTVRYEAQAGPKCDGGSSVDFEFAGAPDAGPTWTTAQVKLPTAVTVAKPWETAPVALTYRPASSCRDDAADQARVTWTRQAEPAGTNRPPPSLILLLTGGSMLPRAVPQDITMSGTLPLHSDYYGVGNAGEAPLQVSDVRLFQAEYLADGGRGTGPDYAAGLCQGASGGDCRYFTWAVGGAPVLPKTLGGTTNSGAPTKTLLGTIVFGADSTGLIPHRDYFIYAVATTNDPYAPLIVSRVRGTSN